MGKVNRCICSDIRFEKILDIAEDRGFSTLEELREHQICACHCLICVPYIKEMLKTGKTSFLPKSVVEAPKK